MNVEMIREERIKSLSKVRYAIHPVLWFEEGAIIDVGTADIIQNLVLKPQDMLETVQWVVTGTGTILMLVSFGLILAMIIF